MPQIAVRRGRSQLDLNGQDLVVIALNNQAYLMIAVLGAQV
jgi:hypothetical protein